MQVTNIEVSFKRTRQPAQYETSGAEIKWSVALEDGEDPIKATETAIGQVKSVVLAELGITKPGTNASASASASTAAPAAAPAAPKAEAPKAEGTAAAPKKSTAKTTEKPAEKPAAAASTGASDIPDEVPTSNGVRTDGPVPGEKTDRDIPDSAPAQTGTAADAAAAGETTVTLEEVNALAHQYRKDGKIDTATIKAISREKFGVERISDLKPEQLAGYKAALEAAVKQFGGPDI